MSESTNSDIPPVVTTEAKPFPTLLEMSYIHFSNDQTSKDAIDAGANVLIDMHASGPMVTAFVEGILDMRVAMFLAWKFFLEDIDVSTSEQVAVELISDPIQALQHMRDDILYTNLISYDQGEYPESNRNPKVTDLISKLATNNDYMYMLGTAWAMRMISS